MTPSPRLSAIALVLVAGVARAQDSDLPRKAFAVLSTHCYRCHGQTGSKEGGMDYVLDAARLKARKKLVPGKPAESKIIARLADSSDPMPPADVTPRPSRDEIETVREWIAAGAPDLVPPDAAGPNRPFLAPADTFQAIHTYLKTLPAGVRSRQRFLSLANLHNSKKVRPDDLRGYRAAVSKLLNSLSWKALHVPELIDAGKTLFAIDLDDYGWTDGGFWAPIIATYPYGLKHNRYPEEPAEFRAIADEVYDWTGTDLPVLRADWFVVNASRPPLYHKLVGIPATVAELEAKLGVNRQDNIVELRAARAGFVKSGVSANNRLVERHPSAGGWYWISYDFKNSAAQRNLIRFPLGPAFERNAHGRFAFEFDGGEIIFGLPNGLQAYMVVDATGKRLDVPPPIEIVRDLKQVSGSPAVVNGVSCMSCHAHGMITDFKDEVRTGSPLKGRARDAIDGLYVEDAHMRKLLEKDQGRFVDSLDRVTGSFWRTGPADRRDIRAFPEPIGPISKWYTSQDLDLAAVADELGLKDTKRLAAALKEDTGNEFARLGLRPLLQDGGTIKRDSWESLTEVTSRFQEAARLLKLGTPKLASPERRKP